MNSFRLYRRLLGYAKPYWPAFLAASLSLIVIAATEVALPALMKPLFDQGLTGEFNFSIWWVPIGVVVIFLFRGAAGFISGYAMSWVANNVLRDLRQEMYNKLLSIPSAYFDKQSSGKLISKIVAEVNGVTVSVTNVVTTIIRDSLILIGLIGWLLWLNWLLTLIVLCLAPILISLTILISKRMREVSRATIEATGQLTGSVEQTIAAHKVIKLFQSALYEQLRFEKINRDFRAQTMRVVIVQALQAPLSQFIVACGIAIILTTALIQAEAGQATVGDFASFLTAILMLLSPIKHLADINAQLQRGLASAESVFTLIDEQSEQDTGKKIATSTQGGLEFCAVTLSYSNTREIALNGISFQIQAGETIALVGPSGGGKTSLINLITRIYNPTTGSLKLDGTDIREFTLSSLRSQVSVVSQDVILMNESLLKNIAYGTSTIDLQRVQRALKLADLEDFVSSLPEGLETNIGDRGANLSGGQRQRLSIARAAYRDTRILILDEATSALDQLTERKVKDALDQLRAGRSTIVIAHRLSTVSSIRRIFVIADGRVVGQGSHAELLKSCRLYERLATEMRS
jgi:subfamily B ATP-binding cassette protein MsbA